MKTGERCGGVEGGMQMEQRKMMLRSREVKQKVAAGSSPLGRPRVHRRKANQDTADDSREIAEGARKISEERGARRRLRCDASCGEKPDQFASACLFLFLLIVSSQPSGHELTSRGSCIIARPRLSCGASTMRA